MWMLHLFAVVFEFVAVASREDVTLVSREDEKRLVDQVFLVTAIGQMWMSPFLDDTTSNSSLQAPALKNNIIKQ